MKTLKIHCEKMSVHVNMGKSKIIRTSIKVDVRTFVEPWVFLHREKYIQGLEMDQICSVPHSIYNICKVIDLKVLTRLRLDLSHPN